MMAPPLFWCSRESKPNTFASDVHTFFPRSASRLHRVADSIVARTNQWPTTVPIIHGWVEVFYDTTWTSKDDGRIIPVFGLEVVGASSENLEGSIEAGPRSWQILLCFERKGGPEGEYPRWPCT